MVDAARALPPAFGRISRGLRMLRRSTLPHARPTLLLMLLAVALPSQPTRSQDRGMQERLDRLERDLSMLQRQVYRSAGSPVPPGSPGPVDSELRMDRIETQMRELTGRVEDAVNGVEQLRRRLEQINSDIDVRFGQGQGSPPAPPPRSAGGGTVASAAAGTLSVRGAPPPASAAPAAPPYPPMPPATLVPPLSYAPAGPGTLTPPKSPSAPQPFAS